MSIRTIRRDARQRVHAAFGVDALYIPVPTATPIQVTVRVHTKFGAMKGVPVSGALHTDIEPKIIFLVSEVPVPRINGVVSVEPGEAYSIDASDPADGDTITARVSRLSAAQAAGLPVVP